MSDSRINNTVDLRVYYSGFSETRDRVADNIVGKQSDGSGCGMQDFDRDLQYKVSPLKAQSVMPKLKAAGYHCEVRNG